MASSYALLWLRSRPLRQEARFVRVVSRLNRRIGAPQVLFSAFFIWGAVIQLSLGSEGFSVLFIYWVVFVLIDVIGLGKSIEGWLRADSDDISALGRITAVIEPNVVVAEVAPEAELDTFQIVSLGIPSSTELARGHVIDERRLRNKRFAKLSVFESVKQWQESLGIENSRLYLYPAQAPEPRQHCIGVVEEGSRIEGLRTIVHPKIDLAAGQLLTVESANGESVYYQAVGAYIDDLNAGQGESYKVVCVNTQQLGIWDEDARAFSSFNWVAPAASPVYRYECEGGPTFQDDVRKGRLCVGCVPDSDLSIHVDLDELVTLNTAILGVTGSGKSYLAFYLIEHLVSEEMRVLVFDLGQQHSRYLENHSPTLLHSQAQLGNWLTDHDSLLGVFDFGGEQSTPTAVTADAIRAVFREYYHGDLPVGRDNPARLCVVFEEAHSLIPEWNQCSRQDQQNVNRTARYLLQFRKYGLGFIVISQRTANVTKTILNQCNTIFAMQCFDQTGFDFLKNYMGEDYAATLSMLPERSAVLVGKASSSARPVIVELPDMSGRWTEESNGD